MAGNFADQGAGRVDVKVAVMALNWDNPSGPDFLPWLGEVKEAGYVGVVGFADLLCGPYLDRPGEFTQILGDHGLELAAVDLRMHTDYAAYERLFSFMQAMGCDLFVCIDGDRSEERRVGKEGRSAAAP